MRSVESEKEANIFACMLLMPKDLIEQDLINGLDLGDNNAIERLCKKYEVTLNALVLRIGIYNKYKK